MPDDVREPFRPRVSVEPPRALEKGFTRSNTSGLSDAELASLNAVLRRLVGAGLSEWEAKRALDAAVRYWLTPADAEDAELERLLAWR